MYSFVDQPHRRLARGNHFLLWAMRCWVHMTLAGRCPVAGMAGSFSRMGMTPALGDFDTLMHLLDGTAGWQMGDADHAGPVVTEDEAVMLSLWSDVAGKRIDQARAVLALLSPRAEVDAILAPIQRIVRLMKALDMPPSHALAPARSDGAAPH